MIKFDNIFPRNVGQWPLYTLVSMHVSKYDHSNGVAFCRECNAEDGHGHGGTNDHGFDDDTVMVSPTAAGHGGIADRVKSNPRGLTRRCA